MEVSGTRGQEKSVGQGEEAIKHGVSLKNSQSFMMSEGGEERGGYTGVRGPVPWYWLRACPEDDRESPRGWKGPAYICVFKNSHGSGSVSL